MTVVTIHVAKTNLSQLLARAEAGEEIVIARGAQPIARLTPLQPTTPNRQFGAFKDMGRVGPEFFEPMSQEDLKLWEGGD